MTTNIEGLENQMLKEVSMGLHQQVSWIVLLKTNLEGQLCVLAAERIDGSGLTFPGGKLESDEEHLEGMYLGIVEDYDDAALRELKEETGIVLKKSELINVVQKPKAFFAPNGVSYTAHPFFAFADTLNIDDPIHAEPDKQGPWKWIPLSQVKNEVDSKQLPEIVLDPEWLDLALRVIFAKTIDVNDYHQIIQAGYVSKCLAILREDKYMQWEKKQLGC